MEAHNSESKQHAVAGWRRAGAIKDGGASHGRAPTTIPTSTLVAFFAVSRCLMCVLRSTNSHTAHSFLDHPVDLKTGTMGG
jgi:hypothetical protein